MQYEAGLQGLVLLENGNPLLHTPKALPLVPGRKLAVVGPQGLARYGLLSDYFGGEVCWPSANCTELVEGKCFDCITTIAEALAAENFGGATVASMGCEINSTNASMMEAAVEAARGADAIILAFFFY